MGDVMEYVDEPRPTDANGFANLEVYLYWRGR
jgi:hypothetical protein